MAITENSIETLKSTVKSHGGLSKSNLFKVNIFGKHILGGNDSRDFSVLAQSVNIPGKQLQSFAYSPYRNPVEVPTGYINDELNMSFILTNDYFVKKFFDKWTQLIVDPSSYLISYPEDYRADINIQQLGPDAEVIYEVTATEAFPKSVKGVDFTSEQTQINTIDVTFAFTDIIDKNQETLTQQQAYRDQAGIASDQLKKAAQAGGQFFKSGLNFLTGGN